MQGLMSINIPTGAVKMFSKCTSGLAWSDHVWWGYKTGIRRSGLRDKLGSPPAVEASKNVLNESDDAATVAAEQLQRSKDLESTQDSMRKSCHEKSHLESFIHCCIRAAARSVNDDASFSFTNRLTKR